MRTLGELVTFSNGGTPPRSRAELWTGDIPWITGADISESGAVAPRAFISTEAVRASSTQVLPANTVLLLTRTAVGKVGLLPRPMAINQDITGVTPSAGVDTRFLMWFLRSKAPALALKARGATIKGVTRADVASLPLYLPPLAEQRRIAAILDRADAIRTKRRQVLAHLDFLTQSIFHDMFGAQRFPLVEAGTIMSAMRNGLSPATSGAHSAVVLTLSAITRGAFDPEATKLGQFAVEPPADKRVSRTDFMMCRGNGNRSLVGVGTYSREDRPDLVFPDTVIAGRVDRSLVDMSFLEFAWRQTAVRSQIESIARTTNGTFKVNQQTLAAITVGVPPMAIQREFAARIANVDFERGVVQRALAADDELFASLQYRAFRGAL